MKAITKNEINFAVNNASVNIRLHKGDYTRECATQIATSTLFARNITPTITKIDDLCFMSFGFPISHRKGAYKKTTGGLTVARRVDRYLFNNHTLDFDVATQKFSCDVRFASMIASIVKVKARKAYLFDLKEKRVTNPVKNVSISKFRNKLSKAFYMHIVQSGKYAY